MCDPLTIAGIAMTAGSTVMNSMAQSKVSRARDDTLAAERIRQSRYDQEADALNTQSQDRYQDFSGQQDAKSKELGDYFAGQQIEANDAANAETAGMTTPQSGSNITVREEQKQRGNARDFTNKTGQALGQLRSFGDLLGGIGRDQARDAMQIGQIGGFKRGSSSITPYELEAANQTGNGAKLFGDFLNMGGGLALNAGLSGAFSPKNKFPDAPKMPGASLYSLYAGKKGLF